MSTPYHVRLAVSQYGEQFRAELFTEDLGDTEGDLLTELPPSIAEWVPYLAQGADLPPDAARQLGKDLFAALLGQPENAKKWAEVLAQATRKGQTIRLLIDATTEAVRDLPYGLLCEPHDDFFLFRGGKMHAVAFVRILRRCSPRPLKLNDRLRVLIAVAEPKSADVPPFDATRRLQKLCAAIHKDVDLIICGADGPHPLAEIAPNPDATDPATFTAYTKTTRDALRKSLAGEYDVFHLLAHGHGAGVLLCGADGAPSETTASELGEWSGAGRTSLAFLQVCKAGQTASRGGFGGVAQQLLNPRGGNLAAVVASTFPLDAENSTDAAIGFYRQLAAGKPPEDAITADRPETDWCWAFLELWARPGALGGGIQQRAAFQFVSPYRGLSSFGEQDADLFFGRKSEVAELLQILRAEPAVAVVGDSGSGKSSLLQAGLIHAIRREGLAGSDKWKIVSLRPGYRPAQTLLTALTGSHAEPTAEVLKIALRADTQPLMIVFDQFEEMFTLARDKAEVQMLTTVLAEAVEGQRDRFRLIIGMRSEFLGQAASVRGLSRLIRRPWVLRPPGGADMRDIVAGPAEHCGYTFQGPLSDGNPVHATGLLDRILADPLLVRDKAGATAAPLPLLQFALERLWLKAVEMGATEFTHAVFDEIGGMGKAIAQHAEAVFQTVPTATELGAPGRSLAEHVITGLVSTQGNRQPRGREAIQAETGNPDAARTVVDYLVGERLLTVRTDPEDMTKSLVDLSHEALIHNWDRLRGWLAEDPQGRAMREEFRKAAEQWESGFAGIKPRSRYGLPGSDVAINYLAWIDTSKPKLSPVQQEFTTAMREMLTRIRRTRHSVMASLAGLAVVSFVLAILAYMQTGRAQENELAANKSAAEAKKSAADAHESQLKAESEKHTADIQAATLALEKGIQICEQGRPRLGILGIVYSLTLCPRDATDLRKVILTNLAAWGPHLLCLDEIRTFDKPILATDRTGKYALLQLPKEGEERLNEAVPNRVQLFRIDNGESVGPPVLTQWNDASPFLRHRVTTAMVLSDGRALLSDGANSSVWDMTKGTQIGKRIPHATGVAVLSPDAKLVAATSNGTFDPVRLYDVATGRPREGAFQHQGKVYSIAFSNDGTLLATGCGHRATAFMDKKEATKGQIVEGYVHLYDIPPDPKSENKPRWRKECSGTVTCVAISPDNKRVTGGAFELRSWKITNAKDDGELIDTRYSPESTVHIAFPPKDSSEFIACNPSGALQILHGDETQRFAGERLSPQGWVAGTGYIDEHCIFTANSDGTVRIWHRPWRDGFLQSHGRQFKPLNAEAVLCAAFRHPDGKAIALGTKSGHVYFAELGPNGISKQFVCADGPLRRPITNVRFSTDGSRIVAQDEAMHHFVFEVSGEKKTPIPTNGTILGVAGDGRTALVSVVDFQMVVGYQMSEVGSEAPPTGTKFAGFQSVATFFRDWGDDDMLRVCAVTFSPDQKFVAIVDDKGEAHLFRTTGERVREPIRHTVDNERDEIRSVAFCPTGATLLTRSSKCRGMWNAQTGTEVNVLVNRIGIQVAGYSPGGKLILGGTNFSMAQVWDKTGNELMMFPMMHNAQVWGVAANQTENRIVTGSFDRTARVWDLVTGRPISPPLMHRLGVSDAVFSPDGKLVLTASLDGSARLWEVADPVPDDPDLLIAWVQVMTGMKVGPQAHQMLTASEWRANLNEFNRRGGLPFVPKR